MSEYVILADSACDLPTEIVDEFGIRIIPISYMLNDNEYPNLTDHSEYPIQKFYKEISEGAKVSTAAINPFELKEFMEVSLKAGKDVIYFAFSSALSCIYRNALSAAEELREEYPERRITIIDSLCASNGFGLYTYICANKRAEGMGYDELVKFAEDIRQSICHEFTVDDLGQLKRGGRISPTKALLGSMLQIKPMLYVSPEGKLISYGKVRGRMASIKMLAENILSEIDENCEYPIFIGHGECIDDANLLVGMIRSKLPKKKFIINYIGPVIGAHSGYKTLSVFCVSKKDRVPERENKVQ